MTAPGVDSDAAKAARGYAWEWFKLHAMQRMTVFNLFLLITGAMITGFLTATINKHYEIALGLSVLELFVVASFYRLDERNAQLVKIGEAYLKFDEAHLAEPVGTSLVRLAEAAEEKPHRLFYSFSQVLRWFFRVIGGLALLGLIVSILAITADQEADRQAQAPKDGPSLEALPEPLI